MAGTLLLAIAAAAVCVWVRSERALRSTWHIDEVSLSIPTDPATIERGRHLAITRGCAECHGADFGGHVVMDTPVIGRMASPNLTPGAGSVTTGFSAQNWEHAIRHGVKPDGHGLLFMPTRNFSGLSDADSADLIAFLQQPAIDRARASSHVGLLGRALFVFGQLPLIEARWSTSKHRIPCTCWLRALPNMAAISPRRAPVTTASTSPAAPFQVRLQPLPSRATSHRMWPPASAIGPRQISTAHCAKASARMGRLSMRSCPESDAAFRRHRTRHFMGLPAKPTGAPRGRSLS